MPQEEEHRLTVRSKPWTSTHRLMVSLPIFIILIGVLVSISNLTTVPWNIEPTGQSMATLTDDTEVTFDNPSGETLPAKGTYEVTERYITLNMTGDGNLTKESGARGKANADGVQAIKVLIREPQNASGKRPGVVFMHGAGYGTCDNSFGDVASGMASAGFVTAVLDKPVWNTTDINRDYPASAKAYDQVIEYLRDQSDVDEAKVGIYATSESTWISSYLLEDDPDVAFQILLSPMVFSPRQSLGFFVTQDFTLVGANEGYQSIVQRVFSADTGLFGLNNFDLATLKPAAYAVPTYVAYGSKDVMTAQVDGVRAILYNAHKADNWNVTVRSYPVANHVLRLGDESEAGTPFADAYVDDLIDWAVGTSAGLTQTSEKVAGANLYQSIGLPGALKARRVGTIYGVILHVTVVLLLLASIVLALVALGRKIAADARWRREKREAKRAGMLIPERPVVLGFAHGFGNALLTLTLTTLATLLIFFAGLGQVIMGVVKLAWGGAPTETPGVMYWSWPVIQVVSVLVLWAWSRVFMHLIEAASVRGLIQIPPRRESVRDIVTGADPVLASTRLGRILFWLVAFTMLYILLVFAFWGLFIY
ncbi:alpha/beta hydrolase [Bifidobacterium longum subsp. longum]|uniref:Alpha/beta hydrolase n=1 Tax=Bifidobacterium longum TaxID=216816 RepID=A0AAW4NC23_BIFLN|nr:alpha/beta hydrolase [Bifidobacterium longum]ALE36603.1 hydrolase of the alpha/beta superfamily [Bifidobacterium longum]AXF98838.1 alpha/beta hydrolase [Bifidobacterium longum subsp. longum]MBK5041565.1 alpha/beta hydrolase [Bifidobacterium longum subsp. longum]MBV3437447.1 alpha/beta hydrolase [Bifidobacterium longum]MBV3496190.1 alpha/beta hydrolase [Bifidobacterium longum]